MNTPRKRRPYRKSVHWTESIYLYAVVWMLIGWWAWYEGLSFARLLGFWR